MTDYRDYAYTNRWWTEINENQMLALVPWDDETPEWIDYDDDRRGFWVPFRWETCESCDGKGKYVNPNIDRNGLTYEDFDEDPDLHDMYFSGGFDVRCEECQGQRVSPVFAGDHRTGQLIESMVAEAQAMQAEYEAEMRFCYGPNY